MTEERPGNSIRVPCIQNVGEDNCHCKLREEGPSLD